MRKLNRTTAHRNAMLKNLATDLLWNGKIETTFEKAKEVCSDMSVSVCDLYEVWEKLEKAEVDVTELLSNKMNHPVKEYHYYIAIKLLEKILGI